MRKCILLVLILTGLYACQNDESNVENSNQFDQDLKEALREASPNGETDYFLLPNDGDYSSLPQDPRNLISPAKVKLGKLLFHETALASLAEKIYLKGTYSCASCHHVAAGFQAGIIQGIGDGGQGFGIQGEGRKKHPLYTKTTIDVQPLRTPSALNIAYQKNVLWNGQFGATGVNIGTEDKWETGTPLATNRLGYEGIETQAIAGLKVHRMQIEGSDIMQAITYRTLCDESFAELPESERYSREQAGRAIAAYERTLLANQANFQKWLRGDFQALNNSEKRGAILFFGKANCSTCHNGPALNDMNFHALGMGDLSESNGAFMVDPNHKAHKGRASFTDKDEDLYRFKTPQLYNLIDSPHYGHGGTFNSIKAIVQYKNNGVAENPNVQSNQLSEYFKPLGLTEKEIDDITNFISTALYDPALSRYVPNDLPSGSCFPNNDFVSKSDLNCGL